MDFKNKKQELKEQLIVALGEWMDNRIDDFLSSNIKIAPFGKYLKRGARNILIMGDKDIDNAISSLLPFIVQDDGDCDISSLFDDIFTSIKEMPDTPLMIGNIEMVIGGGCVKIILPKNPILSLLTDNTTALKITMNDLADLSKILSRN